MPRNVRNFWIELDVDGKKTRVATGPRNKDGGFELNIYMRNKGQVDSVLDVWGYVDKDGKLVLNLSNRDTLELQIIERDR